MQVVAPPSQPPTTRRGRNAKPVIAELCPRLAYWSAMTRPVDADVAICRTDCPGDLALAQTGLARGQAERIECFAGGVPVLGHAACGFGQPEDAVTLGPVRNVGGKPCNVQRPAARRRGRWGVLRARIEEVA